MHSQDLLQSIYDHIQAGNISIAERELLDYESSLDDASNDLAQKTICYLKGLVYEQKGDIDSAMKSFLESCSRAEAADFKDAVYLDALMRIMLWRFNNEDFEECAKAGMRALKAPAEALSSYPATSHLLSVLSTAMSHIWKYSEVPKIAKIGEPYIHRYYTPKDESYYELPMCEAVAYLMMEKPEKADSIRLELDDHYRSSGVNIDNIEKELEGLRIEIEKQYNTSWASKKLQRKETIQQIGDNILLAFPGSPEGSAIWKQYLRLIRETLEFFYFDTSDVEDEAFWNWCLAQLMTRFYVCCDSLPNHSCESYDNLLLKKIFLEYHYGKLYKQPCTWEDVADMLDDGEAAIEISQMPDEFLILKKGIEEPLSIPIDSMLFDELAYTDIHDALEVSNLYSQNGALNKLWMTIEPYLKGINTIYISPSHVFAQYNYSAIPLAPNQAVSDKYTIKNVLSTADIKHTKEESSSLSFSNALLYGGINYDVTKDIMLAESSIYYDKDVEHEWALTRGLSEETRGNMRYLAESMTEVQAIDSILRQHDVNTRVLSGSMANEESVKNFASNGVDILHLSTHGFMLAPLFYSDKEQHTKEIVGNRYQTILSQSGVFLSGAKAVWNGAEKIPGVEDGILTSKEIAALNLKGVKLAVLSACDTGLGDTSNLTGASFGVHYAFKIAGVDKLLVCLWQVDDKATALFMKLFYSNLCESNNLSIALTKAREDMISNGYDSPYYWAPFIIIE